MNLSSSARQERVNKGEERDLIGGGLGKGKGNVRGWELCGDGVGEGVGDERGQEAKGK